MSTAAPALTSLKKETEAAAAKNAAAAAAAKEAAEAAEVRSRRCVQCNLVLRNFTDPFDRLAARSEG